MFHHIKEFNFGNSGIISQAAKMGSQSSPAYRVFSLEELEQATKNFDQSSLLGEGSLGKVLLEVLRSIYPANFRIFSANQLQVHLNSIHTFLGPGLQGKIR